MTRLTDVRVDQITEALAAREHRVFPGKLDKSGLSIAERALVRIAKAPSEDQRDWEAIRIWAAEIGAALLDSRPLHPAADCHPAFAEAGWVLRAPTLAVPQGVIATPA